MSNQLATIGNRYKDAVIVAGPHPFLDGQHITIRYKGHRFSFINSKFAHHRYYAWECFFDGETHRFDTQKETRDWLIEQLERIKGAQE